MRSVEAIEVSVVKQEMAESVIKEEMIEQKSAIKHEMTDVLKQECSFCTVCKDAKNCKTELLDHDCTGKFLNEDFCDHHTNPANNLDANGNQSDKYMECERTAATNMSLVSASTNQLNSVPKISDNYLCCSKCTFCCTCKKKGDLSRHMKQANFDERPYPCSQCQHRCKL